jgi:hypothetical protein
MTAGLVTQREGEQSVGIAAPAGWVVQQILVRARLAVED